MMSKPSVPTAAMGPNIMNGRRLKSTSLLSLLKKVDVSELELTVAGGHLPSLSPLGSAFRKPHILRSISTNCVSKRPVSSLFKASARHSSSV